jgi:nucleoside-diphosphate-sugar epimerase
LEVKEMNYLVTGGTGFIGAHIVKLLIQDGEKVVAYDIAPDRNLFENLLGKEKSSLVKVVQGDITDLAYLIRTCQEQSVEKIIHTAALLGSACSENPPLAVRVNCEGTVNVLETARILRLKRVVLTSSVAVFGLPERHEQEYIPNDAPHFPWNIYGACKSFNEACAAHYFSEYGVDSIAIRFPAVYGEGQSRGLGWATAVELFLKPVLGKPSKVPCGDDSNSWMYVEDAARVMVMASKVATTKTRAFTVDGDVRSFAEAAVYIKRLIPGVNITLSPGRTGYGSKFDTTPVREEIGYRPQWTIEKGMKKVIDYLQKQKGGDMV